MSQSRTDLHALFKTGAKPSEDDFKALIDSAVNIEDDAAGKPSGEDVPFTIGAQGESAKNLLDFKDDEATLWRLNQHENSEDKTGLQLATGSGSSRLFIESSSGKVGVNTQEPTAQVHIQQVVEETALRVDSMSRQSLFVVGPDGKVGVGSDPGSARLTVNGNADISGAIAAAGTSASSFMGKVGVGVADPKIHLAIGDNDTGLQQQGDGRVSNLYQ